MINPQRRRLCGGWAASLASLAPPHSGPPWQGLGLVLAGGIPAAQAATPTARTNAARQPAPPAAQAYGQRIDVMQFAHEVAARHDLPVRWLRGQLAQARRLPAVQRLMMPAAAGTAKNWAAYQVRFVESQRIQAGVLFARQQAPWLARAEAEYGVPSSMVLGIIGVETFYGRLLGRFRLIDALATLSFDFPTGRSDRSAYFRDELAHLLVWARRDGLDLATLCGSYAGAVGLGQFMPGSVLRYGVDFDGDKRVDMAASDKAAVADVIGSIAHYLAKHGWQRGQDTHFAVQIPDNAAALQALLVPDILPSFSAQQMADAGARLSEAGQAHTGPLALVELQNGAAPPSYVAGTANFYAITRYNRSSYYAMAVIELGQAVQHALN